MKYFVALFSLMAILLVLVVLLVTKSPSKVPTDIRNRQIVLSDYANSDVTLRLTVEGHVNALENHRAVRISVGRGLRSLEVINGYDNSILRSKDYGNEQNSFETLLLSLQKAGLTVQTKDKVRLAQTDERGICALGTHYIYEVLDNDQQVIRSWASSCSVNQGTFAGSGSLVRQLFQEQIPDYSKLTQDVAF